MEIFFFCFGGKNINSHYTSIITDTPTIKSWTLQSLDTNERNTTQQWRKCLFHLLTWRLCLRCVTWCSWAFDRVQSPGCRSWCPGQPVPRWQRAALPKWPPGGAGHHPEASGRSRNGTRDGNADAGGRSPTSRPGWEQIRKQRCSGLHRLQLGS